MSPAAGSSSSSCDGRPPSATAIPRRRRLPKGIALAVSSAKPSRPTKLRSSSGDDQCRVVPSRRAEPCSIAICTFSRTVRDGNDIACWKVRPMPKRPISKAGLPVMSAPSHRTSPASGRYMPHTALNSVVLPDPLGPIMPRISSDLIVTSTPASATTPPNRLRTPLISSTVTFSCSSNALRSWPHAEIDSRVPPRQ